MFCRLAGTQAGESSFSAASCATAESGVARRPCAKRLRGRVAFWAGGRWLALGKKCARWQQVDNGASGEAENGLTKGSRRAGGLGLLCAGLQGQLDSAEQPALEAILGAECPSRCFTRF